ncbi:hypothetical protein [Ornithinibacillus contaminans]|uniref:hypothetical protein n=1 Tax=Ornithinibacillus contaminans TaxID=694055 RepID=UPI00064DBBFA|nr:hypothetical protein [Ornithinibacillus contaminans]
MGEKTGFQLVLVIFAIFIIPLLISTFSDHVKTGKLLTVSNEFQQLVSAEGGVTTKVKNRVSQEAEKGINITFQTEDGRNVNGVVPVGEEITIHYEYGELDTSNRVLILKR